MNNDYQLYVQSAITLARTIVIKSLDACNAINEYLIAINGDSAVDKTDKTTWKYYLNLAGQYHSTDMMMTVVSWDTGETINFTVANLAVHKATKVAYAYGTKRYKALLARYPNQEPLILGILNPVDINTAIAANDGVILTYPDDLIESNEYSLIENLNGWISDFKARWVNSQFAITDELYVPAYLGIMYMSLAMAIITFRDQMSNTNEAHSFHVRQHLLSHGVPSSVIRYLTKKQSLFFYRNIEYIQRNLGRIEIFEWLVENILTVRQFPLASYKMRHSDKGLTTNLASTIYFKKVAVNSVYDADVGDHINLATLLSKEIALARNNTSYISDNADKMATIFKHSLSNVVETKVLESSLINYEDAGQYSIESISINHWIYMAYLGYYNVYVHIENNVTGDELALTMKEAYILYMYVYAKSLGLTLNEIPDFPATFVQRIPLPSVSDIMIGVESARVGQDAAEYALSLSPEISPVKSVYDFITLCREIKIAAKYQRRIPSYYQDFLARGQAQDMCSRIYCDMLCSLATGTNYTQWLSDMKIDLTNFTKSDYALMAQNLLNGATGIDLADENSIGNVYNAMMTLIKKLSSYSIQYIQDPSSGSLIDLGIPMVRTYPRSRKGGDKEYIDVDGVDVQKCLGKGKDSKHIDTDVNLDRSTMRVKIKFSVDCTLDVKFRIPVDSYKIHAKAFGASIRPLSTTITKN